MAGLWNSVDIVFHDDVGVRPHSTLDLHSMLKTRYNKPNRTYIAGYGNKTIHVHELSNAEEPRRIEVENASVRAMVFINSHRLVVAVDTIEISELRVYNTETQKCIKTKNLENTRVLCLLSVRHHAIFYNRDTIGVWNTQTDTFEQTSVGVVDIGILDENHFISCHLRSGMKLWSISPLTCIDVLNDCTPLSMDCYRGQLFYLNNSWIEQMDIETRQTTILMHVNADNSFTTKRIDNNIVLVLRDPERYKYTCWIYDLETKGIVMDKAFRPKSTTYKQFVSKDFLLVYYNKNGKIKVFDVRRREEVYDIPGEYQPNQADLAIW